MLARATPQTLDYALLLGQGRSGTNFLLALLNQSPHTHCRNEPDQLEGGALEPLREFRFFVDDEARLAELWDEAVGAAALAFGPRDHVVAHPKSWLFEGARRPGFFFIRQRYLAWQRLRGKKAMDGREIRFPRWMTSTGRLERAFHVFKLNAAVGLAGWALRERPEAKAIQIVRHPGGFVRSWLRRWVRGQTHQERGDADKDLLRDSDRLRALARRDPAWARVLGDVDALTPIEGELYWWRYVNEAIAAAGEGRAAYRRLLFEDLAERPAETARAVFAFCGLPWDEAVAARIAAIGDGSAQIAQAWKDDLEPEVVAAVERVLDGSRMAGWWPSGRREAG